ncbi:CCR4-NOT transcription complex subunit 4 [Strongyloides ratti]|uniref:CCR4-NOT transcription complex subunit 4 n=1 Tax=Strongyloides ratti TaxID=34506 RepID=A0A090L5P9_STRRB|nr:CCR4-NOT transcription complex subunit 4 [Strongyloides ratti]CEF65047.1 CCR4-NOT transcription complex subunit 4 [Strongyloides ratti]
MLENMIGDEKYSDDDIEEKECPLCLEAFDPDEYDFYPCKCEYQICRFCWHRIKEDESGLCPACRQAYPENPVNFKPPSNTELKRFKQEKKQRKVQDKSKLMEPGTHLSAYRVLQKNLVYIIGLSHKYTDQDAVKKCDHFSKYGKIIKVVVGQPLVPPTAYTTQTTFTAYITYAKVEQALSCIVGVNNTILDGRMLKASLGTTKYCSNFLRNVVCNKPDYDMQLGKHTDCERRLIEKVLGSSGSQHDGGNPPEEFSNNDTSRNVSPINLNKDTLYSDMRLGHFITPSIVKKSTSDEKNDMPNSNIENKRVVDESLPADVQIAKISSSNSVSKGTLSNEIQTLDNRTVNDLKMTNKTAPTSIQNISRTQRRPNIEEADDEPLKENFDWKKALGITGTSIVQCLTPPSKVDKEKYSTNPGYDILSDPHKWYLEAHKQLFFPPVPPVEAYKKTPTTVPPQAASSTPTFDNSRYALNMLYQNGMPNPGHTNPSYPMGQGTPGFVTNIGPIGQPRASVTPVMSGVNPPSVPVNTPTTQAPTNNFVSQLHNSHPQMSGTTTPVPGPPPPQSILPNVNMGGGSHDHTQSQQQPNIYPHNIVYHEMIRNMQIQRNYQMLQQMTSMGFGGGQKDFHNMPSNYPNTYQPPSSNVNEYNINNEYVGGNVPRNP